MGQRVMGVILPLLLVWIRTDDVRILHDISTFLFGLSFETKRQGCMDPYDGASISSDKRSATWREVYSRVYLWQTNIEHWHNSLCNNTDSSSNANASPHCQQHQHQLVVRPCRATAATMPWLPPLSALVPSDSYPVSAKVTRVRPRRSTLHPAA